jgi:hypothetical protein
MCTRTSTIQINNNTYALTIETFGPESSASWRCQCCEEFFGSTHSAQDEDEASAAALADVWAHHDAFHVAVAGPVDVLFAG